MCLWAPRLAQMSQGLSFIWTIVVVVWSSAFRSAKADCLKEKGVKRVSKQNNCIHKKVTKSSPQLHWLYKIGDNPLPRVLACGLVASTDRATGSVVRVLSHLPGFKNSSPMFLKFIHLTIPQYI